MAKYIDFAEQNDVKYCFFKRELYSTINCINDQIMTRFSNTSFFLGVFVLFMLTGCQNDIIAPETTQGLSFADMSVYTSAKKVSADNFKDLVRSNVVKDESLTRDENSTSISLNDLFYVYTDEQLDSLESVYYSPEREALKDSLSTFVWTKLAEVTSEKSLDHLNFSIEE